MLLQLTNPHFLQPLVLLDDILVKSLHQVLDGNLTIILTLALSAGWEWDTLDNLDDTVLANGISETDLGVTVDDHGDKALPGVNVDTQRLVVKEGLELKVLVASILGLLMLLIAVVDLIGVQGSVGNNLVLEKGLQVPLTLVSVEQECISSESEALPGLVGRGKDGAANHGDIVDELDKVGLFVCKEKSRELGWEKTNLSANHGWGDKNLVDGVNDTVLGFL